MNEPTHSTPDAAVPDAWATYINSRSPAVFDAVVRQYLDLVYSAALRQTRSPAAAHDVCQEVFILLARRASSVRGPVAGWLFTATRNVCSNLNRGEYRRRQRERSAAHMRPEASPPEDPTWTALAPLLDEGIAALPEPDRHAVLLRYFERLPFRDVGQRLRISEDAARKRCERAVDALRRYFDGAGVTVPSITLDALLLAHAITHAPPALLTAVSGSAASAAGLAKTGLTLGMLAATAGVAAAASAALILVALVNPGAQAVVAETTATAPSTQRLSRFAATLPSGVHIDFLGVRSSGSREAARVWWMPDGTPTNAIPAGARSDPPGPFPDIPPDGHFELLFRTDAPHPKDVSIWPIAIPDPRQCTWYDFSQHLTPGLSQVRLGWEQPPDVASVKVLVADDPWTTAAETPTAALPTSRPVAGKPSLVVFGPVTSAKVPAPSPAQRRRTPGTKPTSVPTREVTNIPVTIPLDAFPHQQSQRRVIATTTDGKDLEGRTTRIEPAEKAWTEINQFDCPPAAIARLRLETRPYRAIDFGMISLSPGQITTPTVTSPPPATQP